MSGEMVDFEDFEDFLGLHFWNESADNVTHPKSLNAVPIVLYSLTCLLGIPGNAFVIWIAGFKMKRTVNTIWFVNLASADFLCCLSIPFSIVEIALDYHWPYGNVLCKVLPTVIILNMFASVFTLTLISLDRFALVIKPVWSQNHRSTALASVLCIAAWCMALALSLPSMIYREVHTEASNDICTYDHSSAGSSVVKSIHVTRFVFGFLLPLTVIIICYSLIAGKVSRSSFSKSQKAFRIILGVIVAFFVCWLPYHIVGLLMEYGGDIATSPMMGLLDQLSVSLAYINSCLNPLLYVFMGQDFKEKVKLSLRRVLENAFSEDMTRSTVHSRGQQSRTTGSSEAQF
ncbi:C3a anaphylatoxin chemotactic receptor [Megalops cyprinoides]|uniref:C3a anaphylatoxin chemotactic receptor n=1 Tax=Megalops cyprinoides TaxID=118141 RepID=UPI0018651B86|nr:C3a anaphylatoxin chemotactic receptor [Megalops cyprinoides]XP_036385308.1 C3a anaphylatoxin chemotactic receptor [Megalops cyprinoides]